MRLRRWVILVGLGLIVGCQPAVSAAPTPATAAPTPVPPPASSGATAKPSAAAVATPSPAVAAPPLGTSRVETLNAADTAFRAGDLKSAAGLYERVTNTPPTSDETASASAAIDDFARFRGVITLLADGREDEARADLDALQKRDPSTPLARLGSQLYDQYGMTGQLRGACSQLQPQVTSQAGPTLATLKGLGVNVDATTLCSVPRA